ncbi:MAG: TIGR03067 domain-containing protein [Gemmataceae bacterium]
MRCTSPALLLLMACPVSAAEPDGELKAFQGKWVLESATLAGRDHLEDFKGLTLTIDGDKYTVTVGANTDKGTITLDAAKSPKWITLASSEKAGPFKGRTMPGLYEFKDGKLTVCLNSETDDRPAKFEAPEKTPLMLFVFVREKK